MKKIISSLLATFLIASAAASYATSISHVKNKMASYLETADYAVITSVSLKTNTYKLTLVGIQPNVTYITDRPYHISGVIKNEVFVKKWSKGKDSFELNAPNAILAGVKHEDNKHLSAHYLFTLSHPVLSKHMHTITYQAQAVMSQHPIDISTERKVYHALLMIDDACLTCVG